MEKIPHKSSKNYQSVGNEDIKLQIISFILPIIPFSSLTLIP